MIKLLILADDFTGALDTGIQFADYGIGTKIITDTEYDFGSVESDIEVVVLNTESRPMNHEDAYRLLYNIAKRAKESQIPWIYKKTDSGLRGNVGGELAAVIAATNAQMLFAPALPELNRTTTKGIHYIEGIPVHESIFGKDPFEPVKKSYIPEIIRQQTNIEVRTVQVSFDHQEVLKLKEPLLIFDAEDEGDLNHVAKLLTSTSANFVLAGCSGFAGQIKDYIPFRRNQASKVSKTEKFFVISGSLNPVTEEQIEYAESNGFVRYHLQREAKTEKNFFRTPKGIGIANEIVGICTRHQRVIIDTLQRFNVEENGIQIPLNVMRRIIADNLGDLMSIVLREEENATYFVTGGDTLMGFVRRNNNPKLTPITEIEKGAVLSTIEMQGNSVQIISKSGGFGDKRTLLNIADKVTRTESEKRWNEGDDKH